DRFQPATTEEQVLVATMVRDAWSLERSSNSETAMWALAMHYKRDDTYPLGRSQMYLDKSLTQVQRRPDSARRNYRRNLELLIKLQTVRKKAAPISQPASPKALAPAIGLVPATSVSRPPVTPQHPSFLPNSAPDPEKISKIPLDNVLVD